MDPLPISIRDVQDTDTDINAITAIYNHAVLTSTATYELDPISPATMRARITAVTEAGFPFIVAVAEPDLTSPNLNPNSPLPPQKGDNNEIVLGYASATPFRPRPAYRFTAEHSIYVTSDHHARGRGIGRALMGVLLERCERLGVRQVLGVVGDGGIQYAHSRQDQNQVGGNGVGVGHGAEAGTEAEVEDRDSEEKGEGEEKGQRNGSVVFHEKLGFRQIGVLEGTGFKFGRWLDTVLMQRAVGGGVQGGPDLGSVVGRMVGE